MLKFRKGDLVSLEATVNFARLGDEIYLDMTGGKTIVVDAKNLTLVRPALEAGDVVLSGQEEASVIAVHEQSVWIKAEGSGNRIVHITDLKRKEEQEPTP